MKCRTRQSLLKRANSQISFTTTCKFSDTDTFFQPLHSATWRYLSIVSFLMLSMAVVLITTTASAQTRAYVTNNSSSTVSVIDTMTNTAVVSIPLGSIPIAVAITPDGTRSDHFCCRNSSWGSHYTGWNPSVRDQSPRQHRFGHQHHNQHCDYHHSCRTPS
jgi:YVTN family beta-propeller protein